MNPLIQSLTEGQLRTGYPYSSGDCSCTRESCRRISVNVSRSLKALLSLVKVKDDTEMYTVRKILTVSVKERTPQYTLHV